MVTVGRHVTAFETVALGMLAVYHMQMMMLPLLHMDLTKIVPTMITIRMIKYLDSYL